MEQGNNKFISVKYQLYTNENGVNTLVEETSEERPFIFLTGFGVALEAFEKSVENLAEGDNFEFTLTKDEAYGDYFEERVVTLDREIFSVNGHFDHENVVVGAVLPLQNEDGNRFDGKVLEITETGVKLDLNHPLAGKTITFKGQVLENRPATNGEIEHLASLISGEHHCGCGCDDCSDGCDHHHHEHGDGCGCGHCH
ncbi:MAG: FKBP-type peptidyl-prolyl cis-trans isomerase [Prevotella sp.]|nr:FKBP-type peptidyl-prolyl cis-trans isomerase [Prevotella sp.]